jgi:hypothetical protein
MNRFLPFTLGILAGAVAVGVARSGKVQRGGEKACEALRSAAVGGLTAIENSSAKVRARLAADEEKPAAEEAGA